MTSSRAKKIILLVWVTSFLICFPQLVGLNGTASALNSTSSTISARSTETIITLDDESFAQSANSTVTEVATNFTGETCQLAMGATSCKLFDQKGYVIYSALGSFW